VNDGASGWAGTFEAAALELGQLFAAGILTPVVTDRAMPTWATVGMRSLTAEERAVALLGHPPESFPPADLAGWSAVAEWWASVRRLTAGAGPEVRGRAWDTWCEIDVAWVGWLRTNYGALLSSASRWPTSVHRVAGHLARRMRDGHAKRVLLVVLDGLGHTQWTHLLDRLGIRVAEAGSVCALVPTYTTVSRQAIFAGDLPVSFPASLWSTEPERRRWVAFWRDEGLADTDAAYHRVKGRFPRSDRVRRRARRGSGGQRCG
jgi:hypothetical protein